MFNDLPIQFCRLVLTFPTTHVATDIGTSRSQCLTFSVNKLEVIPATEAN